jgi:hypothetical protein
VGTPDVAWSPASRRKGRAYSPEIRVQLTSACSCPASPSLTDPVCSPFVSCSFPYPSCRLCLPLRNPFLSAVVVRVSLHPRRDIVTAQFCDVQSSRPFSWTSPDRTVYREPAIDGAAWGRDPRDGTNTTQSLVALSNRSSNVAQNSLVIQRGSRATRRTSCPCGLPPSPSMLLARFAFYRQYHAWRLAQHRFGNAA